MTDSQEALRRQNFKFTLTGAGIAAVIASIIPLIVLFRGEPTAEKVADRSDQENRRLFRNQRKMDRRLVVLEAKLEVYNKICMKVLQPEVFVAVKPTSKAEKPRAGAPMALPTRPPRKCRRGHTLDDGKCVPVKVALKSKAVALAAAEQAKQHALAAVAAAHRARRKAEKRAQMKQQQIAAPASLLRKVTKK